MQEFALTPAQVAALARLGFTASGLTISESAEVSIKDLQSNALLRINDEQKQALAQVGHQDIEGIKLDPRTGTTVLVTKSEAAKLAAMWGEGGQ